MSQAFAAFFKRPTTWIGMMTAIMFQLIFSIIWMTGYSGVIENSKHLTIAVVNEDAGIGGQIGEKLSGSLPFQVVRVDSQDEALNKLDAREVQMVLHIPADFSQKLQTPGAVGELAYTINESNPSLVKSIMSGVSDTVTQTVNKEAVVSGAAAVLKQMQVPEAQAAGMAQGLAERVASKVTYTNPVDGMNNQMVPMMIVLASYVGAMIMAMNMEQSAMFVSGTVGKWQRLAVRSILNVVSAFIVALTGTSLVLALGGQAEHGFFTMWMFQTLFVMTFMFVSQIFVLLFGMAGMVFNIIMLSVQLVTSGALVPRQMLSDVYHTISDYLPATFAVEGSMNLLFGGPSVGPAAASLIAIMLAAIVIGAAGVAARKDRVASR